MILSGRMRRLLLMRSRILIPAQPSALAFLVSSLTRLGMPFICNSAESSIVIIRVSFGINCESAFRNVVLPEPVPPDTKIL